VSTPLFLSPTSVGRYRNCPRSYWYYYIARIRPIAQSATLLVGIILHECFNAMVKADILGIPCDPTKMFDKDWNAALASKTVEFSTTQSPDGLRATAHRLIELFPVAWKETRLIPVLDSKGEPLLEREFRTILAPGVIATARIDGLFMSVDDGSVITLDFKAPAQEPDGIFTSVAEQLTQQQMVIEAHRDAIGIETVDKVGFLAGIRRPVPKTSRGKGPEFLKPSIVPARTPEEVAEYRQNLLWVADDIQRGRFPKNPRGHYNSPCPDCDFVRHCTTGSMEGLKALDPSTQCRLAAI